MDKWLLEVLLFFLTLKRVFCWVFLPSCRHSLRDTTCAVIMQIDNLVISGYFSFLYEKKQQQQRRHNDSWSSNMVWIVSRTCSKLLILQYNDKKEKLHLERETFLTEWVCILILCLRKQNIGSNYIVLTRNNETVFSQSRFLTATTTTSGPNGSVCLSGCMCVCSCYNYNSFITEWAQRSFSNTDDSWHRAACSSLPPPPKLLLLHLQN